jgi:hypothetical protein
MTEYTQIQTYATYDRNNFSELLHRYRDVLERLGCSEEGVLEWLTAIPFPECDDDSFGDIYAAPFVLAPTKAAPIECAGLSVSLFTISGTPSIEQQPLWIGLSLLFDSQVLRPNAIEAYQAGVGATVWRIMYELAAAFREVGIYFTDEWQENRAWRAIAEGVGDPWFFDLAIFPRTLAERFEAVPAGFQGTVTESGFGFALANRWRELPWVETAAV